MLCPAGGHQAIEPAEPRSLGGLLDDPTDGGVSWLRRRAERLRKQRLVSFESEMPGGLAEQVGQTEADAQDAQAGDQRSFPLPTQLAREHGADDAQHDTQHERRSPGDDRRRSTMSGAA